MALRSAGSANRKHRQAAVSEFVRRLSESSYWVSQRLQGKADIQRRVRLLCETQWWEPERIRDLQLRKLQRLLTHCYETVPYYRAAMDERGIDPRDIVDFASFSTFPLLTRELLAAHADELLSSGANEGKLSERYSSGSTGSRVAVKQDRDFDMWSRAHQLRTYSWCGGWRLGDPFVLVWGAPMLFEGRSHAQLVDNRLSRRIERNSFRLDRGSLDRTLEALVRFKPRLISGYTTALYLLAQRALERGIELHSLLAVQTTAEPLPPAMRATIATGLTREVFDKHGSRESSIVAHESPAHAGMCIQAEHTYVEFLDAHGAACRPGQLGRLVLTTLNNTAQPLLRYETTDLACPLEGSCPSGVGLPLMSPVSGRLHDVICTPNGGLVHPQLFSNLMRQFPEVRWFQVVQERQERLTLRVVTPQGPLAASTRQLIAEQIHEQTGYRFTVSFDALRDMPDASTETGKFRVCVHSSSAGEEALSHLNALRAGNTQLPGASAGLTGGAR